MSYDVHIGREHFSYTYNLSKLFHTHLRGAGERTGIQALDDLTGREAADIISRGMDSIEQEMLSTWRHEEVGQPEFLSKYDAPNGWDSTIGAVIFLARLMDACRRHPRSRVEVS